MFWYEEKPERLCAEKEAARGYLKDVSFPPLGADGVVKIIGTIKLHFRGKYFHSIRIRMEYAPSFPERGHIPKVFDHARVYHAPDEDGHINADGSFCLSVPGRTAIDAPTYSFRNLVEYLHVFLLQEHLYQTDKKRAMLEGRAARWPGKAYSHGERGRHEAEAELRRNSLCFCGSGRKYKNCCMRR